MTDQIDEKPLNEDDFFADLDEDFDPTDPGDDVDDLDDDEEGSSQALFPGDDGDLSLLERRALVALLKNQFLTSADNPTEWRTIREDTLTFKRLLNNMFLDLEINLQYEVAYKRQAASESGGKEFPTLLRDIAWGREDTILLAFLRHRYQSERAAGHDTVTVDRDDMVAHVASYRPATATNRSGDESRANNAVDNLIKAKVLARTNDTSRLRVSPVLPVLLPLPKLQALLEWLQTSNGTDTVTADTAIDVEVTE